MCMVAEVCCGSHSIEIISSLLEESNSIGAMLEIGIGVTATSKCPLSATWFCWSMSRKSRINFSVV
jgi:hypothetical protein